MEVAENQEDFYIKFKEQLDINYNFPTYYLYKFIIENNQKNTENVIDVFSKVKHSSEQRTSRNEKYVSVNINALLQNADEIIEYYKKVSALDKVIML